MVQKVESKSGPHLNGEDEPCSFLLTTQNLGPEKLVQSDELGREGSSKILAHRLGGEVPPEKSRLAQRKRGKGEGGGARNREGGKKIEKSVLSHKKSPAEVGTLSIFVPA